MFPSFKRTVFCNGLRRDGNHETHTRLQPQRMGDDLLLKEVTGEQWQGMAFKKYTYEIKRARGESMTSWINRSDEALMDMRKKLATAPGASSSESTMIPPKIQGWLLLHRAKLRDQDIVGAMTMTGGSLNIKLVEKSLLVCSPTMSSSQLIALMARTLENPRMQHAFEAVEEIPEDDDDTYLDDDFSENDDPYIDEDGNLLANEQVQSDIENDLAIDDEEYHEALLGYWRHEIS